jgi:hypothetical protein
MLIRIEPSMGRSLSALLDQGAFQTEATLFELQILLLSGNQRQAIGAERTK